MKIPTLSLEEANRIYATDGFIEGAFRMAEKDYHVSPGWSSSVLMEPTVTRQKAAHEGLRPVDPSDAMKVGSATHCFMFEADEFEDRYAVMPLECEGLPRNKKAVNGGCKEAWDLFKGSVGDKEVLTREQWNTVEGIRHSVEKHEKARSLVFHPQAQDEVSIFWKCPHSGLQCRARIDSMLLSAGLLDLKTTSELAAPDAFWRRIQWGFKGKRGYWVQTAHYLTGAKVVFGEDFTPVWRWLVAETTAPYDVSLLRLESSKAYDYLADYRGLMRQLEEAYRLDFWSAYGNGEHVVGGY